MHPLGALIPGVPAQPTGGDAALEWIGGMSLLGVRVTAVVVIDSAEHNRRQAVGCGAFTDPALLGRLLELPPGVPAVDPVARAETAGQPPGVVERGADGITVIRRLAVPLTIHDVIVASRAGRELRAVQEASLFARFARRWVMATRCLPEPIVLEAKLCGVGLVDSSGQLLASEPPMTPEADAWDWMLREKAYRRWLSRSTPGHASATPAQATDEATATRAS